MHKFSNMYFEFHKESIVCRCDLAGGQSYDQSSGTHICCRHDFGAEQTLSYNIMSVVFCVMIGLPHIL